MWISHQSTILLTNAKLFSLTARLQHLNVALIYILFMAGEIKPSKTDISKEKTVL